MPAAGDQPRLKDCERSGKDLEGTTDASRLQGQPEDHGCLNCHMPKVPDAACFTRR